MKAVAGALRQREHLVEALLGAGEVAGAHERGAEHDERDDAGVDVSGGGGGLGGEGQELDRARDVVGAPGGAAAREGGPCLESGVGQRGGEGVGGGGARGGGAVVVHPVERGGLLEGGV